MEEAVAAEKEEEEDSIDHFSPTELGVVVALASVGTATNYTALKHIWSNFNVRRTLFFLVLADSAFTFCSCAVVACLAVSFLFAPTLPTCSVFFMALYAPTSCGLLITAEVSVIR